MSKSLVNMVIKLMIDVTRVYTQTAGHWEDINEVEEELNIND